MDGLWSYLLLQLVLFPSSTQSAHLIYFHIYRIIKLLLLLLPRFCVQDRACNISHSESGSFMKWWPPVPSIFLHSNIKFSHSIDEGKEHGADGAHFPRWLSLMDTKANSKLAHWGLQCSRWCMVSLWNSGMGSFKFVPRNSRSGSLRHFPGGAAIPTLSAVSTISALTSISAHFWMLRFS